MVTFTFLCIITLFLIEKSYSYISSKFLSRHTTTSSFSQLFSTGSIKESHERAQASRKIVELLSSRNIKQQQAKDYFDVFLASWSKLQLSETAWHRALDAAIRRRFVGQAIRTFELITEQGIVCPAYLVTSLLQLVCNAGLDDVALGVFDVAITAGLEPSVHCFSPLLKSCGNAQKARELLRRMEFVGIEPNVISYTAAIKSCESNGDWEGALDLLDLMRASGIAPNEITFCCLINVASRSLAGDVAVNILREMLNLGFPPNLLCYGSALTACAKVGLWVEVEYLLDELIESELPLQESVLISVINVCRSQQQQAQQGQWSSTNRNAAAEQEVDDSSIALWSHATDTEKQVATKSQVQWARALWLVQRYGLKTVNVTESVYTMAMDVCESAGRYTEVLALYNTMIDHRVAPSKSSFNFALRACTRFSDGGAQVTGVLKKTESAGLMMPFMYNSTLSMLDTTGRYDVAIRILRRLLTPNHGKGRANNAFNMNAEAQALQLKLVSPWLVRRIVSVSLEVLTRSFSECFSELKDGKRSPSAKAQPFVDDLTSVLRVAVHEKSFYIAPGCCAMANKLLIDSGDLRTLRVFLNGTLYRSDVNATRLLDYAVKSITKDYANDAGLTTIQLLLEDTAKALNHQQERQMIK